MILFCRRTVALLRSNRVFLLQAALPTALLLHPGLSSAQTAPPESQQTNLRPLVIGLGAVAGVIVFNVAVLGVDALPGGIAYGAGATVPAEMSVAMSRVYATASAVAGGLIAYYGYAGQ